MFNHFFQLLWFCPHLRTLNWDCRMCRQSKQHLGAHAVPPAGGCKSWVGPYPQLEYLAWRLGPSSRSLAPGLGSCAPVLRAHAPSYGAWVLAWGPVPPARVPLPLGRGPEPLAWHMAIATVVDVFQRRWMTFVVNYSMFTVNISSSALFTPNCHDSVELSLHSSATSTPRSV